jgi:hypothetical protein
VRRLYSSCGIAHAKITRLLAKLRDEDDVHDAIAVTTHTLRDSLQRVHRDVCITETLILESGKTFDWTCVSLTKMLQFTVRESVGFQTILRSLWERQPCTADAPYTLVIYGDEIVPGNILRLDNRRKVFCVYVTIKELGHQLLKDQSCWFPIAALRTVIAKDVVGGISAVFKVMLRRLFLVEKIGSDGICIDLAVPGTGYVNLYFGLGNIVADGDALRGIWSSKGASGKLPCLLCKNVVNEQVLSPYVVDLSCCDPARFDLITDEQLWQKVDALHAQHGVGTKKSFAETQIMYGITYCPEGLLWDIPLRTWALSSKILPPKGRTFRYGWLVSFCLHLE